MGLSQQFNIHRADVENWPLGPYNCKPRRKHKAAAMDLPGLIWPGRPLYVLTLGPMVFNYRAPYTRRCCAMHPAPPGDFLQCGTLPMGVLEHDLVMLLAHPQPRGRDGW